MKSFRILAAVSVAGALAATGIGAAFLLASNETNACSLNEGTVLAYLPTSGHSCPGLLTFSLPLYRRETVDSVNPGQLTFHTNHLSKCIEFRDTNGSADVLYPRAGIAIRHIRGKTWCLHLRGDGSKTLLTPGAIIRATGTIFGIDSKPRGSLIKVTRGKVRARSMATRQTITIRAGYQALIPTKGQPQRPRRLQLDTQDQEGAFFLRYNILSMGPAQPIEYLKANGEDKAVVVAQDTAQAQAQARELRGAKVQTLTAAQVIADPQIAFTKARQIGAHTIVVAGDFNSLKPTLTLIATGLPSDIALLFASATT